MKIRCKHLLIALLGANVLMLFGGYFAVRRLADVAAVQAALERNWEINFNDGQRPPLLPVWADNAFKSGIDDLIGSETKRFSGPGISRRSLLRDRIWALFRGRITSIEIFYPERMREDLGAAVARFPLLRKLVIHEADFSSGDWNHFFAGLRSASNLEELEIGGPALDDRAIAPLEGCRIKRLVIFQGGLAEFSPAVFAKMPELKELTILSLALGTSDVDPPIEATQRMIREALPGVKVVIVDA